MMVTVWAILSAAVQQRKQLILGSIVEVFWVLCWVCRGLGRAGMVLTVATHKQG